MGPDERDLDEEIRGHLALSVQDRIERGESPEAARLAALREFGYVPAIRDSMRRVWYTRWFEAVAGSLERARTDLRLAVRQLLKSPGFTLLAISHARARYRGQHLDVQRAQRDPVEAAPLCRQRATGEHLPLDGAESQGRHLARRLPRSAARDARLRNDSRLHGR